MTGVAGFRRIVVATTESRESQVALDAACRLADERGAVVTAVAAIEVPVELPLDCLMDAEEALARDLLERAAATIESFGVKSVLRLVRARQAGTAILDEVERQHAELLVVGVSPRPRRRSTALGATVEHVVKAAPCRVMLITGDRSRGSRADAAE